MRILHVTHQYPPAVGGAEKYIADLSEELVARGHQVDVFTSRSLDYHTWKNELPSFERINGVNVYRFWSMQRTSSVWKVLHWSLWHYWRTRSCIYEPFIWWGGGPICPGMFAALLARLPAYDVIHLNCLVYSHVLYGYIAARLRGVPVVVTPHLHIEQEATYGIGYQLRILRGADHIIAVTGAERDFLLSLGLHPWRVTVAGNGLRTDAYPLRDQEACRARLGIPQDAFVILFLGRQEEYKGIGTVLKSFTLLSKRYPQLFLLVAGPETDYSRQIFTQGYHKNILNMGSVSNDTRLDVLNACDCLVLPSKGEAFGIVFLEAWLAGKPVIGPATPAVASLIKNGEDGWTVPVDDPLALFDAVKKWLDEPNLAIQMGVNGRKKVLRRYTISHITDVVEGVYLHTLRATSSPRGKYDGYQYHCASLEQKCAETAGFLS